MARLIDVMARWEALGRPFRALPRWGAALLLTLLVAALAWSSFAVTRYAEAREPSRVVATTRTKAGTGDLALYERINRRMEAGEGYYAAALAEQRAHNYPTIPFVTVRTPIMAWGSWLFGQTGWRVIAIALLVAATIAWIGALQGRTFLVERAGAALLLFTSGGGAFLQRAGLGGRIGLFATLWFAGFGLAMALFARANNFYWALLVLPAYGAGLALAPRAIADCVTSLFGHRLAQRRSGG